MKNQIKTQKTSKTLARNFLKEHYQVDSEEYIANCTWYGAFEKDVLVAVCGVEFYNKRLVCLKHLVVDSNRRKEGIGFQFYQDVIQMLKGIRVGKVISHIYVKNTTSLVAAIKEGYLIEGLMRDNDHEGSHVYTVGKIL